MKRLLVCLVVLVCLTGCTQIVSAYSVEDYTYDDLEILDIFIEEYSQDMAAANQMIDGANRLGHPDIAKTAREEWEYAYQQYIFYKAIYDDLSTKWKEKEEEYPTASYIWNYLKDYGYSVEVRAGILGNMMAEAGGNTLDIDPIASNPFYYGICQWGRGYDIWEGSLEEQCDFLVNTIEQSIDVFGFTYKKNFDYEDFMELDDAKEVALAFAKCYERCDSRFYGVRKNNAITAYNYFVS